jgi:hybrid cluster-associated redox disulfide protein
MGKSKISQKNKKITKDWIIQDIFEKHPKKVIEIGEAFSKFGIHCIGCAVSSFETIGDGVMAHGFSKKELESILKDLNKIIGS